MTDGKGNEHAVMRQEQDEPPPTLMDMKRSGQMKREQERTRRITRDAIRVAERDAGAMRTRTA